MPPEEPASADSSRRLNELRQQRDLVRRHLDWLDAQIDLEESKAGPTDASSQPVAEIEERPSAKELSDAEIMAQMQAGDDPIISDSTRKGCLVAAIVSGLGILLLFWLASYLFY